MNWFSTTFNLKQHHPVLPSFSSLLDFCVVLKLKTILSAFQHYLLGAEALQQDGTFLEVT